MFVQEPRFVAAVRKPRGAKNGQRPRQFPRQRLRTCGALEHHTGKAYRQHSGRRRAQEVTSCWPYAVGNPFSRRRRSVLCLSSSLCHELSTMVLGTCMIGACQCFQKSRHFDHLTFSNRAQTVEGAASCGGVQRFVAQTVEAQSEDASP